MNENLVPALRNMADDIGNIGASPFTVDLTLIQLAIAALEPQWQPIETAPKDTVTEILAWDGYDMRVTRWYYPYKAHPGAWYESQDRYETLSWEPTHWQPLPASPEVP